MPDGLETIPGDQMNFIPEQEVDPETGLPKPKPFKQKPYEPTTEYGF